MLFKVEGNSNITLGMNLYLSILQIIKQSTNLYPKLFNKFHPIGMTMDTTQKQLIH